MKVEDDVSRGVGDSDYCDIERTVYGGIDSESGDIEAVVLKRDTPPSIRVPLGVFENLVFRRKLESIPNTQITNSE